MRLLVGITLMLVGSALPRCARAYCRTTTCDPKSDASDCAHYDEKGCIAVGEPIFWPHTCVGYDVQRDASKQVSYEDARRIVARAFAAWESVQCEGGPPSMELTDLGPVSCRAHEYNPGGNANIILFRDDGWPHPDKNDTLALTTVTYNPSSGLIYDADMEINASKWPLSAGDTLPKGKWDLQSIVTHEAGHFLGFAHTTLPCLDKMGAVSTLCPTMTAGYDMGRTDFRTLSPDDEEIMCAVYPPSRQIDPTCDLRPRHGFSEDCGGPGVSSCFVSSMARSRPTSGAAALGTIALAALVAALRRLRRCAS